MSGAGERNRTVDLRITNALLYQLSYTGGWFAIDNGFSKPRRPLSTAQECSSMTGQNRGDDLCTYAAGPPARPGETLVIQPLLHEAVARRGWRILLLLLMLTVCFLAFSSRAPSIEFDNADKWQHLAAFFALSACASLSMAPGWRGTLGASLSMLAFGVFIEVVQMFLPARSAEWQDVLVDAAGIALGLLAVTAARRLWPRSGSPGLTTVG